MKEVNEMIGEINRQGNWLTRDNWHQRDTSYYFKKLVIEGNFEVYSTSQDAPYFGVYVDFDNYVIITFAEGDEHTVYCLNQEQFHKELHAMDKFYKEELDYVWAH
jgi:hypothetical protein